MVNMFNRMMINDLHYGMNVSSSVNDVITKNIANNDTPYYKAEKLVFEEVMDEYFSDWKKLPLTITNKRHIEPRDIPAEPSTFIRHQNNMSTRNDFNDVNLDFEMSSLASNSVRYSMMAQITGSNFAKLKEAIRGR